MLCPEFRTCASSQSPSASHPAGRAARDETVKESIREGSLGDLLETHCRSHPRMLDGLKRLGDQKQWLESLDSASKSTFYLSSECASRPEVVRYERRIDRISSQSNVLITDDHQADTSGFAHVLHFKPPFGPYPVELSETYPFNAEVPEEADNAALDQALKITKDLIRANPGAEFRFRLKNRELEELLRREQTIAGAIQGE